MQYYKQYNPLKNTKSWLYKSYFHDYYIYKNELRGPSIRFQILKEPKGIFAIINHILHIKTPLVIHNEYIYEKDNITLFYLKQTDKIIFNYSINNLIFRGFIKNKIIEGTIVNDNTVKKKIDLQDFIHLEDQELAS